MAARNGWKRGKPTTKPPSAGKKPEKDGAPIISYDAIFFDFDGVLVESTELKIKAFETLYAEHGPDITARVLDYMSGQEGISRIEKIRYAHREFLGIDLTEQALSDLNVRFSGLVEDAVIACPWVPGAEGLLAAVSGTTPTFVVTGTPDDEIQRIVERRGMGSLFTAVRGSPPRKPPIVRELLASHSLQAERCLFVGDARFDFETARETGLDFIGRLLKGLANPFPDSTKTVTDMHGLAAYLGFATAPSTGV